MEAAIHTKHLKRNHKVGMEQLLSCFYVSHELVFDRFFYEFKPFVDLECHHLAKKLRFNFEYFAWTAST